MFKSSPRRRCLPCILPTFHACGSRLNFLNKIRDGVNLIYANWTGCICIVYQALSTICGSGSQRMVKGHTHVLQIPSRPTLFQIRSSLSVFSEREMADKHVRGRPTKTWCTILCRCSLACNIRPTRVFMTVLIFHCSAYRPTAIPD